MAALETKIKEFETALGDPDLFANQPDKYSQIVEELSSTQTKLAACEDEWLELEMLKEGLE